MKLRAVLLSLLAHGALLGGAVWVASREPLAPPDAGPVVEAPLGSVFVQEEGPAAGEREKAEAPAPSEPLGAAAPSTPAKIASGGSAGLPTGEAEPLGKIEPGYPAMSRKLGEEGEAVFDLEVGADGSVAGVALTKSSGHERLDQAAREALARARFRPAESNGAAVISHKRLRIEFRLK